MSNGLADDLSRYFWIKRSRIDVVYNPVADEDLLQQAAQDPRHPWLEDKTVPVVIGVGRLMSSKRFDLLLQAVALLRRAGTEVRVLILGSGRLLQQLTALAAELGISEHVCFLGYQLNPYAFMARADLMVLSSDYEGLPTVLVEAMACGCPVVATDCPSGPAEILDGGRYGALVPMGDARALADAVRRGLRERLPADVLRQRAFAIGSVEANVDRYLDLLGIRNRGRPAVPAAVVEPPAA